MAKIEVQLRSGESRHFEATRISADADKIQLLSGTTMDSEIVAIFPLDAVSFVALEDNQRAGQ